MIFSPRSWSDALANTLRWGVCWLWIGGGLARLAATDVPSPAAGANVDETRVQHTLYVDPANAEAADDDRHGTAEAPFATLRYGCQAAERFKDANQGVKLLLAPGTYRETAEIHPPGNGQPEPEAPLVIEAAERDQTVLDGADTEGWSPSTWKEEPGRCWSHPWPFAPAGGKPAPYANGAGDRFPPAALAPAYRHGALLVINGTPLPEVNTAADLRPGTFCLQGGVPAAPARRGAAAAVGGSLGRTVVVQPPEDTPLGEAIIQVGVRARGLEISGRRNVVVRGLCIQHAAAPAPSPAAGAGAVGLRIVDCSNVLVEDVLSQWNDGTGLDLGGTGRAGSERITVRRVRLLHNGGTGFALGNVRNLLVEDSEASFNNFRGEWVNWIDSQRLAGVLAVRVDGSTWRRQRAVGNQARGWWFSGAANLTIEEAVVRENRLSGVLFDACPGPTLLRRSLVTRTEMHPSVRSTSADAGVAVYASPDLTMDGNLLADNAVPAFSVADVSPGVPPPGRGNVNRDKGIGLRAERHTLRHNIFYGREAAQNLVALPAAERLGTVDFSNYFSTLQLRENCFWNPAATEVFLTYDLRGPRRPNLAFDAWTAFLTDRAGGLGKAPAFNALWQDPLFLDPAEGDFQVQEHSPVEAWNMAGEERATTEQEQ